MLILILQKPQKDTWSSGLEAMQAALELEKTVNQCILDLHALASKHNDPHVSPVMLMSLYSITCFIDIKILFCNSSFMFNDTKYVVVVSSFRIVDTRWNIKHMTTIINTATT